MGILDLYADGISADIQRRLANPPAAPGADFSTASFLAAGMRGVPAAVMQMAGSATDVLGVADREVARRPRLGIFANQPETRGAPIPIGAGDELRAKASSYAPDATTAHVADQVLFGLTRMGTKVAAATAVGNLPVAAGLLAGEEGNTAYRELRAQGIDHGTALKTAAVQGAGAAAMVLPMVGSTIKSTIAIGAATGPGAFMAQEALSRKILADAGYHDEASKHDPLDPLGLTLSTLIPGVVGGVHAIGLARAARPRPTLASVVEGMESGGKRYGKDGALLTSPKGAQGEMQVMPGTATDPGFGVVPAKDSSPEELARVGRDYLAAMEHRYGDPAQAMAAYNAGPGAVDKALSAHGADWLQHLPAETQAYVTKGLKKLGDQVSAHASSDPAVVDAARVRVTNDALHRSLPDQIDAHAELMRASDEVAAGQMPAIEPLDGFAARMLPVDDVRSTQAGVDPFLGWLRENGGVNFADKYDITGEPGGVRLNRGGVFTKGGRGLDELAQIAESEGWLPPGATADIDGGVPQLRDMLQRAMAGERIQPLASTYDAMAARVGTVAREGEAAHMEGKLRLLGVDPEPARGNPDVLRAYLDQHEAKLVEHALSDAADPPAGAMDAPAQRGAEARSETRNALPRDDAPAEPAAGAHPVKAPLFGSSDRAAASGTPERARVDQLLADSPDLPVVLPGADQAMSVREALAQMQREFEHDAGEVELLRAAALCALASGG